MIYSEKKIWSATISTQVETWHNYSLAWLHILYTCLYSFQHFSIASIFAYILTFVHPECSQTYSSVNYTHQWALLCQVTLIKVKVIIHLESFTHTIFSHYGLICWLQGCLSYTIICSIICSRNTFNPTQTLQLCNRISKWLIS